MYRMTPPAKPRPRRKRLNLLQILLIVAVVGFAGWYVYTQLAPAASPYATISSGTLGARYTGDALIVRDEVPYDAEGVTKVEYVADEGSTVYHGSTICNVYSNGYSTKETTTLQSYRDQIRDYELSLIESETANDARMERLDNDLLGLAREFRQMINGQRGNLLNQESLIGAAITARQNYVQSKYSTDQRLSRLLDDEQSQEQRISSWTKQYAATGSEVIVSFYFDGYEYGLTPATWNTFTPQQVRKMINGSLPDNTTVSSTKTTIYRTINDGVWYALFLCRDETWNPVEGAVYELRLERSDSNTVEATVEFSTRSGGELLVGLRVDGPVSNVLYTRTCTAEVGENVQSLMVPARAIYTQDNMTGVVVLDGSNKLFIPVNVLLQDGDNVYIESITQGLLYVGQTVLLF